DLLHPPRSSDRHRKLAAPLQYDPAACLTRLQATSTRGVRARLRRVAGCATSTGFAGHAGATANLKLTFHPDHSVGANQSAGIDRTKCLISLKATGEQKTILSPVYAASSSARPTGRGSGRWKSIPVPGA